MQPYAAPVADMRFVLNEVIGLDTLAALPGLEATEPELIDQILEEGNKFASNVLAPLNMPGDQQGARIENGVVRAPDGFGDAYSQFWQGGWNSVPFDPDWGGQGLPWTVSTALWEMWDSANMAFSLCPLLTQAAIDAMSRHASQAQKDIYLEKLVTGEWTGAMCLTEPQSGTDLGSIRTKAERHGDHYLLRGQKIYITWGDHDMVDNIVHLVLARSPDGPPGTKGLSLFIVPKFHVNADGSLGARNDFRPVSIEHKLGIHASPTCVMSYGENEGAVAYLVGEENRGIEYMFVMMNNARLAVGLEGVAIAERAYQQAVAYAKDRVQGRAVYGSDGAVSIIRHPDVRRMLMSMRSRIEAMRALCYHTAAELDAADRETDPAKKARAQAALDLMIPVVKAWCTDQGLDITSTAIQVHGGMGFIEETGIAQHYRDARITTIYEGTNGVQAMDLVGRKVARDGGEAARTFLVDVRKTISDLEAAGDASLTGVAGKLAAAADTLEEAVTWMVETFPADPARGAAVSVPFLDVMGLVASGWMMGRSALKAHAGKQAAQGDLAFYDDKITTARFFANHSLSRAPSLITAITEGGESVMALAEDRF